MTLGQKFIKKREVAFSKDAKDVATRILEAIEKECDLVNMESLLFKTSEEGLFDPDSKKAEYGNYAFSDFGERVAAVCACHDIKIVPTGLYTKEYFGGTTTGLGVSVIDREDDNWGAELNR